MKKLLLTAAVVLLPAQAFAEQLPTRKPGLWEINIANPGMSGHTQTVKQCTDEATDAKMMQSGNDMAGKMGVQCAKNEVRKENGQYIGESDCTFSGTRMVSKTVFSGDFASSYTAETETTYNPPISGMSGGKTMMTAKRVGECEPGQKPGDIIMPGGITMNINSMPSMGGANTLQR